MSSRRFCYFFECLIGQVVVVSLKKGGETYEGILSKFCTEPVVKLKFLSVVRVEKKICKKKIKVIPSMWFYLSSISYIEAKGIIFSTLSGSGTANNGINNDYATEDGDGSSSKQFLTDSRISSKNNKEEDSKNFNVKKLVKWESEKKSEEGLLEEELESNSIPDNTSSRKKKKKEWDMYKANEIESDYKDEVYTTAIDWDKVSNRDLLEAEVVAKEIQTSTEGLDNMHVRAERNLPMGNGDVCPEDLHSSVLKKGRYKNENKEEKKPKRKFSQRTLDFISRLNSSSKKKVVDDTVLFRKKKKILPRIKRSKMEKFSKKVEENEEKEKISSLAISRARIAKLAASGGRDRKFSQIAVRKVPSLPSKIGTRERSQSTPFLGTEKRKAKLYLKIRKSILNNKTSTEKSGNSLLNKRRDERNELQKSVLLKRILGYSLDPSTPKLTLEIRKQFQDYLEKKSKENTEEKKKRRIQEFKKFANEKLKKENSEEYDDDEKSKLKNIISTNNNSDYKKIEKKVTILKKKKREKEEEEKKMTVIKHERETEKKTVEKLKKLKLNLNAKAFKPKGLTFHQPQYMPAPPIQNQIPIANPAPYIPQNYFIPYHQQEQKQEFLDDNDSNEEKPKIGFSRVRVKNAKPIRVIYSKGARKKFVTEREENKKTPFKKNWGTSSKQIQDYIQEPKTDVPIKKMKNPKRDHRRQRSFIKRQQQRHLVPQQPYFQTQQFRNQPQFIPPQNQMYPPHFQPQPQFPNYPQAPFFTTAPQQHFQQPQYYPQQPMQYQQRQVYPPQNQGYSQPPYNNMMYNPQMYQK